MFKKKIFRLFSVLFLSLAFCLSFSKFNVLAVKLNELFQGEQEVNNYKLSFVDDVVNKDKNKNVVANFLVGLEGKNLKKVTLNPVSNNRIVDVNQAKNEVLEAKPKGFNGDVKKGLIFKDGNCVGQLSVLSTDIQGLSTEVSKSATNKFVTLHLIANQNDPQLKDIRASVVGFAKKVLECEDVFILAGGALGDDGNFVAEQAKMVEKIQPVGGYIEKEIDLYTYSPGFFTAEDKFKVAAAVKNQQLANKVNLYLTGPLFSNYESVLKSSLVDAKGNFKPEVLATVISKVPDMIKAVSQVK